MNKTELVETIAQRTDLSKKDVQSVLDTFEDIAGDVVAKGKDALTIPGLPQVRADPPQGPHRPQPADRRDHPGPAANAAKVTAGAKLKASAKNG